MPAERRLTAAEIRRKTNKPIMEKKRRERINNCLDELKELILTTVKDEAKPNKLEKADILEMTLQYLKATKPLKNVTDFQPKKKETAIPTQQQQQSGYTNCIRDVNIFLHQFGGISMDFQARLLAHLTNRSNTLGCDNKRTTKHVQDRVGIPSQRLQNTTVLPKQNFNRHYIQCTAPTLHSRSPSPVSTRSEECSSPGTMYNNAPTMRHISHSPRSVNYLSGTDSGHWSSGSNPPSPTPNSYYLTKELLLNQTPKSPTVWRPW